MGLGLVLVLGLGLGLERRTHRTGNMKKMPHFCLAEMRERHMTLRLESVTWSPLGSGLGSGLGLVVRVRVSGQGQG